MRKVYRTPQEQTQLKAEYNKAYREANRERLNTYDHARKTTDEHRAKRREQNRPKIEARRARKAIEKQNMPPAPPITERLCPSCNPPIPKPVSEFGKDKSRKDGYAPYCKKCTQEKAHARLDKRREYEQNRPQNSEYHAAWRHRNQLRWQGYQLQRLARKKGADIINRVNFARILERDGMHCYICDKPILPHHILTFDHVIPLVPQRDEPQGTHTEDNIHPAHKECNARKSNRRLENLTDFDRRGPTQTNR